MDGALRQSEIITDFEQFIYDQVAQEANSIVHPYLIILTQDCDLLRDYEQGGGQEANILNGVLLFELQPVEVVRQNLPGGDILRRIRRHTEERYHILQPVSAELDLLEVGFPELIIDFRRCFTAPPHQIYQQCVSQTPEGAKRRTRLAMPYREHLQNRAAYFLQRVALPEE